MILTALIASLIVFLGRRALELLLFRIRRLLSRWFLSLGVCGLGPLVLILLLSATTLGASTLVSSLVSTLIAGLWLAIVVFAAAASLASFHTSLFYRLVR